MNCNEYSNDFTVYNTLNDYKKDFKTGIFYDQKFKNVIKKIEKLSTKK